METKRATRDDHLFVASRDVFFFRGFLLVSHLTFSTATSLSNACELAHWPCQFFIHHHMIYGFPVFASIRNFIVSHFSADCCSAFGLFTFNSMRCLVSELMLLHAYGVFFSVSPDEGCKYYGYGHNESTKLVGSTARQLSRHSAGVRFFFSTFYSFASILSDFYFVLCSLLLVVCVIK